MLRRFGLCVIFFVWFSFFSCLSGCAVFSPAEIHWGGDTVQLSWPPPPNPARIRYLRTLNPAQLQQEWKGDTTFLRWLTGENENVYPLVSPYGITADGTGRIWVADIGIKGVHIFDLARRKIDYIFSAGDQPLESPVGVAADIVRDRLYLSDSVLQKVFVYSLSGRFLEERHLSDGFGRPAGLTVDMDGRLYVVDVVKNRVTIFTSDGAFLRHITSQREPDRSFLSPSNVAVDLLGQIYVSDTMHFLVEIFDREGGQLRSVGEVGDGPGAFARPRGVALDSEGHLYVVDAAFGNIQVFDSAGQLLIFFGSDGEKEGEFSLPAGIYIDQMNRIYVSDAHNGRIQIFQYQSDSKR